MLALVLATPVAPEALRRATAANVSSRDTAEDSALVEDDEDERLGTLLSEDVWVSSHWSVVRLGTLTLVSFIVSVMLT